ncbi:porin family protein [Ohtaekwangia koreensis]|uniref:Outer membrane protein beta-barrel family protein n=1 Tax=Ohtaekwangia koreensis TaxID=688867 RepID=A0A1T5M8M4_9BACT|nr:hypothetical protein [Ohtaekwangia koreensis]SKC84364.1 hypothetical protein SAMN05660236_4756 [Ohtaekwangia koreensis]
MRKLYSASVFCVLFLLSSSTVVAQNLESIGKETPITITGGVSLNQIFYTANGINNRRDPYTYFASGNVNFSLYGWSVPLSFSLSNQNTSFQQPFNQYSLHPTYKFVTAHAGYISMSYSPYTVNGHIFLGGAVDLAPEGNWKFSVLYGRFLKAVQPEMDTGKIVINTPSFKRMGYGFKTSYAKDGTSVDLVLFHAKDDISSISSPPDSLTILPQENLVVSIGVGQTFFDNFLLKAEVASSALSRDIRAEEGRHSNVLGNAGFLYTPRLSSSYYKTFKSSLNYQQEGYTIGVGYERVDPQYRTLGAYYFNSDLESITVNGSAAIVQGKINIAVSAGTQRDNLDKSKVSTMRRMVGSVNVNYIPTQKLNLSASYSSFQTYTNIRSQFTTINSITPYDNLDTLNYTQISQNATATAMYTLGNSKERRQSINLNVSFQDAADKQGEVTQNSGSQFYNVNAAYSLNIVPQNLTVSLAFNGNVNESPAISTKTMGPTASVSKTFFDRKLRATLSSSYNNSYTNSKRVSTILNGRVNGSYTIQKKHNLNLSLVAVNRESQSETSGQSFTEFTGTLGYSYAFGIK